MLVKCSDR